MSNKEKLGFDDVVQFYDKTKTLWLFDEIKCKSEIERLKNSFVYKKLMSHKQTMNKALDLFRENNCLPLRYYENALSKAVGYKIHPLQSEISALFFISAVADAFYVYELALDDSNLFKIIHVRERKAISEKLNELVSIIDNFAPGRVETKVDLMTLLIRFNAEIDEDPHLPKRKKNKLPERKFHETLFIRLHEIFGESWLNIMNALNGLLTEPLDNSTVRRIHNKLNNWHS